MISNLEKAFEEVAVLVNSFNVNYEYSEAAIRKDFIDKFFISLGWDVNHDEQKDPWQQEVKIEKTQFNQKRPDYTFCLSPDYKNPKFFVEAKKPARELKDTDFYFQTIKYGWSASTPIAVLTDFAEIHILDCRYKPNIKFVFNSSHKIYNYSEYTDKDKFAEIYYLLSHDAVLDNSLDRYAKDLAKPTGKAVQLGLFKIETKPIDDDILEFIDSMRETLAKAFKKNDENLESDQLTEAVQRTIDRLIFIRFLEDKGIEPEYYISEFGAAGNGWKDFISRCRKLDAKYNGIVFKKHFIDDQEFKGPELKDFSDICNEICHLNSPYDFNAIPIHILGSIYERFLGKVVHATDKRVTIEEKPEVRKAGGVYYTPKYIVDYIVKNTIGELVKDKTPSEISKLRVADISCGSGSFVIGAFDFILDYHNHYYQNNPDKAKKDGCHEKDGQIILSIKQKQKILLNNIYGIDIDNQAVEVTQLSLALKMLEDETTATANDMQVLFHERILPDLSHNIICGNSLIGTDIFDGRLFSKEEEKDINVMEFNNSFPEVFKNGGFDCIIGNPPYVKARESSKDKDIYREYLNNNPKYTTLKGMWDLYIPFVEKGIKSLKPLAYFSFIVPDTIEKADYASELRNFIISNYSLFQIDFFPNSFIFKSNNKIVGVKNIILFVKYSRGLKTKKIIHKENYSEIDSEIIIEQSENSFIENNYEINFLKIPFILLGDICYVSYGLRLNSDENKAKGEFQKKDLLSEYETKTNSRKFIEGKFITKYSIDKIKWVEWNTARCPSQLVRPTFPELYAPNKLLLGNINMVGIYDDQQIICDNTLIVSVLFKDLKNVQNNHIKKYFSNVNKDRATVEKSSENYDLKYILGLCNSKAIQFYLRIILRKGELHAYPDDWKHIPIPSINIEKQMPLISLVDQMLSSQKELHQAKTDKDKLYYERRCNDLDTEIDRLVYKLYGLTEDERKIVEESIK